MNRAQRRAEAAQARGIQDHVQRVHDASNGILQCQIVTPEIGVAFYIKAMAGDNDACAYLLRCGNVLRAVREQAGTDDPVVCATCRKALRSDHAITCVLIVPDAQAEEGLGFAACRECTTLAGFQDKVKNIVSKMWRGGRVLNIHPEAGNA